MSGVSAPCWPTWLDIAVQIVEKFRPVDKRTRTVSTRVRILPDAPSEYLKPLDARPLKLVRDAPLSERGEPGL